MKKLMLVITFVAVLALLTNQDATPPEPTPTPIDLENQSGVELWVFKADWCKPCRDYEVTLKIAEAKGIKIRRIDIDEHPELMKKHNIRVIPTTLFMEDDEEQDREEGNITLLSIFKLLGDTLKVFLPKLLNIIFMV